MGAVAVTPGDWESSSSSSATVIRPSEDQLRALDEVRKKAKLVESLLDREVAAAGVTGVGVVVGDDWVSSASSRM